ncbi:MAG: twin-arginine translocation signal domain-containing protein [Pirellulaceae bacterium]|nr:twin-arginine translocation signal domain-containing protein [Pirellulaceae bacterium]
MSPWTFFPRTIAPRSSRRRFLKTSGAAAAVRQPV